VPPRPCIEKRWLFGVEPLELTIDGVTPGTERSRSSTDRTGAALMSSSVMTVVLTGSSLTVRSLRVAVTTIVSDARSGSAGEAPRMSRKVRTGIIGRTGRRKYRRSVIA
jgi:hypothetical protein